MHIYNLILAGIWLVIGVSLLALDYLHPGAGMSFRIGETDISLGWVALALVGYNLLRWYGRRSALLARRQREFMAQARELADRDRKFRESGRVPDPNFMFDEPPRPQP
jgi:hypothetical protein